MPNSDLHRRPEIESRHTSRDIYDKANGQQLRNAAFNLYERYSNQMQLNSCHQKVHQSQLRVMPV